MPAREDIRRTKHFTHLDSLTRNRCKIYGIRFRLALAAVASFFDPLVSAATLPASFDEVVASDSSIALIS